MGNTYFITGINGFLGRTLASTLLESGNEVHGLRLPGDKSNLIDGVTYYLGDVGKIYSLMRFMRTAASKEAVLIHCAGRVSIASEDPMLWKVNVDGTRNIVDLCEKYGIRKLIYISSVHAIAELSNGEMIKETNRFSASLVRGAYGKSKAEATCYVKKAIQHGMHASIIHPSGIIGPEDYSGGYMTELIRFYLRHGLPLAVEGGYDFVDVRDVAEGIIRCAELNEYGEDYILSNEYISVKRMFDILANITGKRKVWGSIPLSWMERVAPLCEKTFPHLGIPELVTPYSVYTLGSNGHFSHEKANDRLGYHPRPIEETLTDVVKWIKTG